MSDDGYQLRIYTPTGLALEDFASQVTLPASDGEIGVLQQHIKYTGLLGTGVLEYFSTEENRPVRLVISGGFCNFSHNTLVVLADSVDLASSVDLDNYAKDRRKHTELLGEGGDASMPEWRHAQEQLKRIEAIDDVISH
ncbi:F0F1 ATP synthase subunit epsilon [Oligoflexia bacterium]|nr:F0F1 ATP synthase subunit epsilon [Oligoflexia bacterium]